MRIGMLQVEVLDHPARATRWDEAATALYCLRGKIRIFSLSAGGKEGKKIKDIKRREARGRGQSVHIDSIT